MQNGQFGSKIFFSKNMLKMNRQEQLSSSVQKTAGKNSQNSRNVSILKTGHFGKSIAYANWGVWVKKFFLKKYAENESTRLFNMFCAKNRLQKTANIREIRPF